MLLENISLLNFKNYEEVSVSFGSGITCFVGKNGSGKTNLLDAIYFLCLTKSAFMSSDANLILHELDYLMVNGSVKKEEGDFLIGASYQKGQKKLFKVNKQAHEKLSHHIGHFPAVLIAPDDTDLIREGSESRRKYFDGIISQMDAEYLVDLLKYNNVLKQRNELLKSTDHFEQLDLDLIVYYDEMLISLGQNIFTARKDFIEGFIEVFQEKYQLLTNSAEKVSLSYKSQFFEGDIGKQFKNSRKRDFFSRRTNIGVHKDDFEFLLEEESLKKFGSQGQQKSFVIALKLAQFKTLKEKLQITPILLLDDIFDKLDDQRIAQLMTIIKGDEFGQIFLTDAREERTIKILDSLEIKMNLFTIDKGTVTQK